MIFATNPIERTHLKKDVRRTTKNKLRKKIMHFQSIIREEILIFRD